jgi:magnesium chelatase subunit D
MTKPTDAAQRDASGDALLICRLLAADPHGLGGVALASGPGPGRDAFLSCYKKLGPASAPFITVPAHVSPDRLEGGLDIAATLAQGKPISSRGLIASADHGVMLLLSAERLSPDKAARIASAMDHAQTSRFGIIACDESRDEDEALPKILSERIAFRVNPDECIKALHSDTTLPIDLVQKAHKLTIPKKIEDALAETALMLGIQSPRALIFAFRVARLHGALSKQTTVTEADATIAAQLVFAHRATQMPFEELESDEQNESQNQDSESQTSNNAEEPSGALADRVLDAVRTHLPEGLLAKLDASALSRQGRSGQGAKAAKAGKTRGRPLGARRGDPRSGARLDLVETLRVAAPWQRLRRQTQPNRTGVIVHKDDFRVRRFKEHRETTAIFVVDASGSSAIKRLAEAKGAVELILADCYVRRDRVAVIAFRSKSAEILLHPTRSLQRAKRSLAELPGGGGTPLTAAIETTLALADQVKRTGGVPLAVFLTDGRANITRDGTPDKAKALSETESAAKALRASGIKSLVIDLSDRPEGAAKTLAAALDALYLPLPHAEANTISNHVGAAMKSAGRSS